MINVQEFDRMVKELSVYDERREELIKKSRDVLKLAKQLIYALHRGEKADGHALSAAKSGMDKIGSSDPQLLAEGSYCAAVQEYAEAMCYLSFIHAHDLPSQMELGISTEDYLLGLCDLTGELARRAVREATARDKTEVERINNFLEAVEGQLIRFNFRNGELRKKYDAVKWNIKKVEEVLYDLSR